jgi:hypothetical protein
MMMDGQSYQKELGSGSANAPFTSRAEAELLSSAPAPVLSTAPPSQLPKIPSAPWCVNEWSADLNMSQRAHGQFPMDLKNLTKQLGVPLQLYVTGFC